MKVKIKLVDIGIANRFENTIEIHKDLINDVELFAEVLEHELNHDNSLLSFSDFIHEFKFGRKNNFFKWWKFMLLRPRTWIQRLPTYYDRNHGIVYDVNLIIIYLAIFIIFGINLWLVSLII